MDEIFQHSLFLSTGTLDKTAKENQECILCTLNIICLISSLRCSRSTGSKYLLMSYFLFFSNQYIWRPTSFAMLAKSWSYLKNKSSIKCHFYFLNPIFPTKYKNGRMAEWSKALVKIGCPTRAWGRVSVGMWCISLSVHQKFLSWWWFCEIKSK